MRSLCGKYLYRRTGRGAFADPLPSRVPTIPRGGLNLEEEPASIDSLVVFLRRTSVRALFAEVDLQNSMSAVLSMRCRVQLDERGLARSRPMQCRLLGAARECELAIAARLSWCLSLWRMYSSYYSSVRP